MTFFIYLLAGAALAALIGLGVVRGADPARQDNDLLRATAGEGVRETVRNALGLAGVFCIAVALSLLLSAGF